MLIHSPHLQVQVFPEIGGKIAQITDVRTGRTVFVPPRVAYRTIEPGEHWVHFDTSGMDDCFPNVEEGPYPFEPWTGTRLPQLGEWVYGAWDTSEVLYDAISLARTGVLLPYVARKAVDFAAPDTLRIRYQVENTSGHPIRYLWSAHPLIAVEDEYIITVPGEALRMTAFPPDGAVHQWPQYGDIDLSRQWIPNGQTLKVFVENLSEGWCELQSPALTLRFEFDLTHSPALGLWFNNYGFTGGGTAPFRCLAIEPCTTPSDALHALSPESYPLIEPGARAEWWMTIRVN